MPALLAGQSPNCRERGRGGDLMIDLDRIVAPREPLRRPLQGAGEQVAVAGIEAVIEQKRRQPVGDGGESGDGKAALALVPLVVAAFGMLLLGEVREAGAECRHQRLPARPSFGLAQDIESWKREQAEHGACFLEADIGEVRRLVAPIGVVEAAEARRAGIPILDGQQAVGRAADMAELIEDVALQSKRRADRERAEPRIRPDATFHPLNPRMLPMGSIASFLPAATSRIWPLNQPLTPCWAAVGLLLEERALTLNPSPVA